MYLWQYILLAGFSCLLLFKAVRFPAIIFIAGWLFYLVFIIDIATQYKYMACGTIELSIAYALNSRFRVVSWLGYLLILVNVYGLILFKSGYSPLTYDVIYAIISITQFIFLLARLSPNGLNRLPAKHFMVRLVNFDSRTACDIMYKNIK